MDALLELLDLLLLLGGRRGVAVIASRVLSGIVQLLGPLGEDQGRVVDALDPQVFVVSACRTG